MKKWFLLCSYGKIEEWRMKPIEDEHPYIFLDGVYLKRSWGGEVHESSVLVAIGVNSEGYRKIPGVAEGSREDKESWSNFLRYLKERGLKGVQLVISDKAAGLADALGDFFLKLNGSIAWFIGIEMLLISVLISMSKQLQQC